MVSRTIRCLLIGLFLTGFAGRATAVLVAQGAELPETLQPPADDPGWSNIGRLGTSTAIYLGNRWVLSARHVPVGPVTFGDTEFQAVTDSVVHFQNDSIPNLSKDADLVLFQIAEDPQLPPLQVSSITPSAGGEVVVIGNGFDSTGQRHHWNVSQRGSKWTWSETSGPGDYSGYRTNSTTRMRWGTNLVEDEEIFGREFDDDIRTSLKSNFHTVTILTEFDAADGVGSDSEVTVNGAAQTRYESQAVLNDSGGALFFKDEQDTWKLAGVVLSVEGHPDQPDVTRYAIFGDITYYADLPSYVDQIEQHFVYGDFDQDQQVTARDVDALSLAMAVDNYDPSFDLNRDGAVNFDDRQRWVDQVAFTTFGDSNLDGFFGTSDLVQVLQAGLYEDDVLANATWATGDWDGNLEFDTRDLVLALQSGSFERESVSSSINAARAVPEPPASLMTRLILITAALVAVPRARRASRVAAVASRWTAQTPRSGERV